MEFQNIFFFDVNSSLIEMLMSWSIFCILIYSTLISVSNSYGHPILAKSSFWLAIYSLLSCSLVLIDFGFNEQTVFQGLVLTDGFVLAFRIVTVLSAVACIIISFDYIQKDRINLSEASILILLSVVGSYILVGSNDFLVLYLAIEMQSLCFYVLASFKRNSSFSTESGLKYFVLGAFSSGLLLFGCSLVYGFSGTTNFEDVFRLFFNVENSDVPFNGLFMGVLFILLAFMFKIAASPFHVWITDIYEGSPTFVTAYFSVVPKIAIFGLTLKLTVFVFENFQSNWQVLTVFCGISSLFVGCFGALYQRKVKRLLAYSAIGHTGYLLIGLSSNSIQGVEAVFFYIIVYVFMGTAVFCIILNNRNTRSLGRFIFLTEFLSFSKLNPVLAFIFTVILFSMAGIPPLAGFLSKMNIFLASVGAGLYTTTGIALVLSGLGAVYYIRIIKIMYFEDSGVLNCYSNMAKASSYILVISFSFLVLLIAYPNVLNVFVAFACTGFFL